MDLEICQTFLDFKENVVYQCTYLKVNRSKFISLVFYVDGILLVINDVGLFNETKQILSKTFWMKDLGEASFFLGIEIYREIL